MYHKKMESPLHRQSTYRLRQGRPSRDMPYATIWVLAVGLWWLTWSMLLVSTWTPWSKDALARLKWYSWGLVPGVILLCFRPRPVWPDPWGPLARNPSGWLFWVAFALVVASMGGLVITFSYVVSHLGPILVAWLRRPSPSDQVAAGSDRVGPPRASVGPPSSSSWLKIGRHRAIFLLTSAGSQYIGSHSDCRFQVSGSHVEPYHARVVCEAGEYVVYWVRRKGHDVGFTAVFVDGRSIQSHVLQPGDKIAVGQAEILFGTGNPHRDRTSKPH